MSLLDKFSIIENHISNLDEENIKSKINNFLENYLHSNSVVLMSDFLYQFIWFNKNLNVKEIIQKQIKKFLIERRNNFRSSIKKDLFDINSFVSFITNYKNKIDYIQNIFSNILITKQSNNELVNLIISDSIINIYIQNELMSLDSSLKDKIEQLFKIIEKLDISTYQWFIRTIGNMFISKISFDEVIPYTSDIQNIYNLNIVLKLCKNIESYYSFCNDLSLLMGNIFEILFSNLIKLLKENNVYQLEIVLKNIYMDLKRYFTNIKFETIQDYMDEFYRETFNLIDKNIKNISTKNVISLINVIKYLSMFFSTNSSFKSLLQQRIGLIISNEQIIEQILNIVFDDCYYNDDIALSLIEFLVNVKEKDRLCHIYYNMMSQRILNLSPNINMTLEKNIAITLTKNLGEKLCYKINKVIVDTENSIFNYNDYMKLLDNTNNFITITTSYNNWNINQQEGMITKKMLEGNNTIMTNYLLNYNKYYDLSWTSKRIINWFPHFGRMVINYNEQDLIMLPVQFMVLELFNNIDSIDIETILNYKLLDNYSKDFKENIIKSLVISGILKIKNKLLIISTNIKKTNLIDILFNETDTLELFTKQQQEEFVSSRIEIISTNINHHIKKKSMTHQELFDTIYNSIDIFELTEELFTKSIKYLIDREIIGFDSDKYSKIYY